MAERHRIRADPDLVVGAALVIVGGFTSAVGAYLPWVTATSMGRTRTLIGVDGAEGWLAFAMGALILAAGVAAPFGAGGRSWRSSILTASALTVGLGIYEYRDVQDLIPFKLIAQFYAGPGTWAIMVGGVLGFAGGLISIGYWRGDRSRGGRSPWLSTASGLATIAGGFLLVAGSEQPWLRQWGPLDLGGSTVSGVNLGAVGWATFAIGVLAILLGLLELGKGTGARTIRASVLLSPIASLLVGLDIARVREAIDSGGRILLSGWFAFGLWIVGAGAALIVIATALSAGV